jgi:ACS family sodium-dependent inorganic phosphate cotransporter-like MFS transporter 5
MAARVIALLATAVVCSTANKPQARYGHLRGGARPLTDSRIRIARALDYRADHGQLVASSRAPPVPSGLLAARSVQGYLLMLTRMFQQSNRNLLGLLLVYMAKDLHFGIAERGSLLSAIAVGYLFTQVPGGALADKLGAKNVMTATLLLSGLCCIAVPLLAGPLGLRGVWLAIAVMGAVQGPMFPTSSVFLSRWMPGKEAPGGDEKAWGTSMLDIGISLGSLLIIPTANTLADAVGWRGTYLSVGFATVGFALAWHVLAADSPKQCWYISAAELAYLQQYVGQTKPKPQPRGAAKPSAAAAVTAGESGVWRVLGLPRRVALHPGVWAVFFAHMAFNFGAYYMTNWNPTYYVEALGLTAAQARIHLAMPHVTNLAAKALNPALVAMVAKAGVPLLGSRRLFTSVGFFVSALCILPVARLKHFSPWVSTVLFSLANAFFGLSPSGFKANYLDITEKYVGIIAGYGNTLGTVASWAGPQIVAALLQRFESWDLVLATVAASNAVATLNYVLSATVDVVEK